MKTIRIPIQNNVNIAEIQRIYSSAVRYAYNRFLDDRTEKEIRALMKDKFCLGSWICQCSIKHAQAIYKSQQDLKIDKIIFGSKSGFIQRIKNKINNCDWKALRLMTLQIQGEKANNGNRHFVLDVENNNQIIFKQTKDIKHFIQLPSLRKNIKNELILLEHLSELPKPKGLGFSSYA